jgi:hypothetical protein
MPGRREDQAGDGRGDDVALGRTGKNDGGVGMTEPENRIEPGEPSARSAGEPPPAPGGQPPPRHGRDSTANATETPELDSFDREG